MTQIGITLYKDAHQLRAPQLADLGRRIEGLGFESVWFLDPFGRDPFLISGFVLANTTTLKVGTGVATVYGRDPMATVQARETLSECYPGRFIMGLGASNPIVIAKRKGEWIAPLPKMTAYLEAMAEVQLVTPKPAMLAPLHIAAHAPGLQDLAVRLADGVITWVLPPELVRMARDRVGPALDVTACIPCVVSSNAEEAREIGRRYLSIYLPLAYYQSAYSKAGFDSSDYENRGSDRLIDAIVAWGEPAQIKERVAAFSTAGATRVVLNPLRLVEGATPGTESDWDSLGALASALI